MASFRSRCRSSRNFETSGAWLLAERVNLACVQVGLEMFEFPDLFLCEARQIYTLRTCNQNRYTFPPAATSPRAEAGVESVKRLSRGLFAAAFAVWAALKFFSDAAGVVAMIRDPSPTYEAVNQAIRWVALTPWWIPAIFAALATGLLFWRTFVEIFEYVAHPNGAHKYATVRSAKMDLYLLGIILSGTVLMTCTVLYFTRSGAPVVSQSQLIKKPPFFFLPYVYSESRSINTWGGKDTELYEISYYLGVGNDEPSGKNLKRVQVRLFGYDLPTQTALMGPNALSEVEMRHGEVTFFKIGRVITKKHNGTHKGSISFNDKDLSMYLHNVNLGVESFEIWSSEQKRQYGLSGMAVEGRPPPAWPLGALISADDTKSAQIWLNIDFGNDKTLVSISEGNSDAKK
jgi:hypothetical protein